MSQIGSISSGGGGGGVATVTAGTNISVTGTATNPIVNVVAGPLFNAGNVNLVTNAATVPTAGAIEFISQGQYIYSRGFSNIQLGTGGDSLTSGDRNTLINNNAGIAITTGSRNFAGGPNSLFRLVTGNDNVTVGYNSGSLYTTSESNNIVIGSGILGTVGESNTTRIGNGSTATFIAGIDGVNVGSVATVVTEAGNQLGTATIIAGANITITPTANTITIAASGGASPAAGCSFNASVDGTGNTIPAGATQLLVFNNVNYNNGSNFTTNNTFTAPATALYYFNFQFDTSAAALGDLVFLYLNGAPVTLTRNFQVVTPGAQFNEVTSSTILPLTAGDTIQCFYQNTGAVDAFISGGFPYPGQQQSWFEGYKLT